MNLNLDSKKIIDIFEDHIAGKKIELLFSKNIHTLFYPYSVFQIPSELHLLIQSNDLKDVNSQFFVIKGSHFENPDDGWKETLSLAISQTDIDRNILYEKYSTLLYRNKNNACFYINNIEYYYIKTESETTLFSVCLIEDGDEQILITHHGFGNGLELVVGKKSVNEYFKENPFGKKLIKYTNK